MIERIYIEEDVSEHPRTKAILEQFPNAAKITCSRYTEIFNKKSQNFRLQKKQPALILANKFKKFVLATPENYGIGAKHNYYFSHTHYVFICVCARACACASKFVCVRVQAICV